MSGVALITGGQQGIGFGIAQALAKAGYKIALASLPPEDDPKVQEALEVLGGDVIYLQHDISKLDDIPSLLDTLENQLGPITTLINNAGIGAPVRGDMLEMLPQNFDHVMDVNLRGAFFLSQAVAKRMLEREYNTYRSILFVTSVSAGMVSIERAEYCLSKSAAAMMSQLYAARLAPHGIGVFELRPGIIATEMTAGVKDKYTARIEAGLVPAARWGTPSDIADVVVPLVTGQMAFATGATIPVDGGLSIARL